MKINPASTLPVLLLSTSLLCFSMKTHSASPEDLSEPSKPPFRIAKGVIDLANSQGLGLKQIPCETVEIYHAKEGASFSHHPGLIAFKDQLYCSWSGGKAHEDRPDQYVYFLRTSDGKHWSDLRVLAKPEGNDRCGAAGFLVTGNTLVAYYTLVREYPIHNLRHPETALFAVTSQDGENWSKPHKVSNGFFIEGPLRLPGGRLIIGGEHTGGFDEHKVRMRLLYSDNPDGISDWKEADIHPEKSEPKGLRIFDYTESCPFVRKDGVVVAPFRNSSGHLYASVSRDNGDSWSVPVETNFPDSMARFSTGTLPTGSNWIINNPGPERMNRQFLTISLSDDGVTFNRAWLLRGEPTAMRFAGKDKTNGWQYPSACVWKNRMYIAYSVNKEDIMVSSIALEDLESDR